MAEATLTRKLGIRPGQRGLVLHAPAELPDPLGGPPAGVTLTTDLPPAAAPPFDFALVFFPDKAAVDRWGPLVVAALRPDGLLWAAYPKIRGRAQPDLTRDRGWDALTALGLRVVSAVAIDDVWSGLRFRPITAGTTGR